MEVVPSVYWLNKHHCGELTTPRRKYMTRYLEWRRTVDEWKKKYNVILPPASKFFDPTSIKLTSCKRCKNGPGEQRHHKGHDFFFARLAPDEFAARYCLFSDEDCDRLCRTCHERISLIFRDLTYDITVRQGMTIAAKFYYINQKDPKKAIEYLKQIRQQFLDRYQRWINAPFRGKSSRRRANKRSRKK